MMIDTMFEHIYVPAELLTLNIKLGLKLPGSEGKIDVQYAA